MDALGKFAWRALKKLELRLSAAPRATRTLLSCSPNFPRASITRYTHAKHEPILNCVLCTVMAKKENKNIHQRTFSSLITIPLY